MICQTVGNVLSLTDIGTSAEKSLQIVGNSCETLKYPTLLQSSGHLDAASIKKNNALYYH